MSSIQDSIFMRSLQRKPVERTPIWIMRQAGRYLPEYRAVRQQAGDFLSLCKNPELACEVTLQPLRRFDLDAAILFSDILTIPDAMGLGLYFAEGEGPRFKTPLRTEQAIEALTVPSVGDDLQYVMDAAQLIRQEMPSTLPLIGFSGSPWTLACYMVEGGSGSQFKHIIDMMYAKPQAIQLLLEKLAQSVTEYLLAQVKAGVNALMIFDTWGGILSTPNYKQFSLQYMTQIVKAIKSQHPDVPIILFTKGGGQWLKAIADSGCDALGLDWTTELGVARGAVGERVALQGNLDPSVLRASPDIIIEHVKEVLASFGHGSGYVFNLGHGITPDIPPEHVKALVDAVHRYSPAYH
jgi:uroporphyrinogen decarboxylase